MRGWCHSLTPPPLPPQGGRGGHGVGPGREQPGHRVGAGGSALRLQPQVQQAGQGRVPHALRAHLAQAGPAGALGGAAERNLRVPSYIIPRAPHPPSFLRQGDSLVLSLHIYRPLSPAAPPSPDRTIHINIEAPAKYPPTLPPCCSGGR